MDAPCQRPQTIAICTTERSPSGTLCFLYSWRNCVNLTQFLLVRSKQGLGWDRVCAAQRSNESPSGAFKRQRGLRQQMEGRCPDKRYPNKITWKTRKSLRSEVPVAHKIFMN